MRPVVSNTSFRVLGTFSTCTILQYIIIFIVSIQFLRRTVVLYVSSDSNRVCIRHCVSTKPAISSSWYNKYTRILWYYYYSYVLRFTERRSRQFQTHGDFNILTPMVISRTTFYNRWASRDENEPQVSKSIFFSLQTACHTSCIFLVVFCSIILLRPFKYAPPYETTKNTTRCRRR